MSNCLISNGKTLYDVFNVINPNCYQAFIIQYIIEDKKEEAIKCCNELTNCFKYYKWERNKKPSGYVDSLICESNLDKWKKLAIIHIITNDVEKCKNIIVDEINKDKHNKNNNITENKLLCELFNIDSFL